MVLLRIAGSDYSEYVNPATYNVNRSDVFNEWQDANGSYHRDIYRTRISGSFEMGFKTQAQLTAFTSFMEMHRTRAGYYPVSVYVNNTDALTEADVFFTMPANIRRDEKNGRLWAAFTVNIEER